MSSLALKEAHIVTSFHRAGPPGGTGEKGRQRRMTGEEMRNEWEGGEDRVIHGLITVGNVRVPIQRNEEGLCGGGL